MSDKKDSKAARRDFLRGTATGTVLAAAALAVLPGKAWAKPETKEERKKARYKKTPHVEQYYKTNGY